MQKIKKNNNIENESNNEIFPLNKTTESIHFQYS